jgi:hypothetical protein
LKKPTASQRVPHSASVPDALATISGPSSSVLPAAIAHPASAAVSLPASPFSAQDFLLFQMFQQQIAATRGSLAPDSNAFPGYAQVAQPNFFENHANVPRYAQVPASAQTLAVPIQLPRPVSLVEFCQRYQISPQEQVKLTTLDVVPGDHAALLELGREDWEAIGGFSKLAWGRFLTTHQRFLVDVQNGLWA